MGDSGGGIAHITHLGGLVAGYVMLRGRRLSPADEVRYRYLRWKMDRARKKFGVHTGGKSDWDKRVHLDRVFYFLLSPSPSASAPIISASNPPTSGNPLASARYGISEHRAGAQLQAHDHHERDGGCNPSPQSERERKSGRHGADGTRRANTGAPGMTRSKYHRLERRRVCQPQGQLPRQRRGVGQPRRFLEAEEKHEDADGHPEKEQRGALRPAAAPLSRRLACSRELRRATGHYA